MNDLSREITITNIQRFSLHDGPGIRTTVFVKGCSLHCPWCSNPENISHEIENYYEYGQEKKMGKKCSLSDIYTKIIRDKNYYDEDGGVTFSGGEVLLYADVLEPLYKQLRENQINICIETSLFSSLENLKKTLLYLDEIIVDIKILNGKRVESVLGGNLDIYKRNFDYLSSLSINKIIRMPLIEDYTTDDDNIQDVARFLKFYDITSIELIKGHNLAEKKYNTLGRNMMKCKKLSFHKEKRITNIFNSYGVQTIVCNI